MKNLRQIRVVAGAIVEQSKLLVAQRNENTASSLLWEVPGGKVEAGESDQQALIRELREELEIDVRVHEFLASSTVVVDERQIEMLVYRCSIQYGQPQAIEHKQIRWMTADQLSTLSWAPADIPILPQLLECTKGN